MHSSCTHMLRPSMLTLHITRTGFYGNEKSGSSLADWAYAHKQVTPPPSVRHVWSPRQQLHTVTETFSCSHILLRLGCKNDGGLTSLWLSMMTKEQITAVSHPTSSFPVLYAITDVLPSCLGVIFLLEDIGWVNVCAILDGERRTGGGGRGWGRATGMAEQYLLSWLHKSAFTIVARKTSHCTQLPSLLLVYRCFLILSFPPICNFASSRPLLSFISNFISHLLQFSVSCGVEVREPHLAAGAIFRKLTFVVFEVVKY